MTDYEKTLDLLSDYEDRDEDDRSSVATKTVDEETIGDDDEFDVQSLAAAGRQDAQAGTVAYSLSSKKAALRPSGQRAVAPSNASSRAPARPASALRALMQQQSSSNSSQASKSTLGYSPSHPNGVSRKRAGYANNPPPTQASARSVGGQPPPSYGRKSQASKKTTGLPPAPGGATSLQENKEELETLNEEDTQMTSEESGTGPSAVLKEWAFEKLKEDQVLQRNQYEQQLLALRQEIDWWKMQAATSESRASGLQQSSVEQLRLAQENSIQQRNQFLAENSKLKVQLQHAGAQNNILLSDGNGMISALRAEVSAANLQAQKQYEELVAARQTAEQWKFDSQTLRVQLDSQNSFLIEKNAAITHLEAQRSNDMEASQRREQQLQELTTELRNRIMAGQTKDAGFQAELDRGRALLSQKDQELRRVETTLSSTQAMLNQAQVELPTLKSKLQASETLAQEMRLQSGEWRSRCSVAEARGLGLQTQLSTAVADLADARAKLEQAASDILQLNQGIAVFRAAGSEIQNQAGNLQLENSKLVEQLAKVTEERDIAGRQLASVVHAQRTSSGELETQLRDALLKVTDMQTQIDNLERDLNTAINTRNEAIKLGMKYKAMAKSLQQGKKSDPMPGSPPSSRSPSASPVRSVAAGRSKHQARYLYTGSSKTKPAKW